jgi:hypothetical protein
MADARREWVQPASCSRKMAMIFLKSRVFGKFPCIGRSRGEIASIPVPGNAPWFGGKPLVRNDYSDRSLPKNGINYFVILEQ